MIDDRLFCGYTFIKGIGFWVGLNFAHGNLCVWLPFLVFYISLPKCFKIKGKYILINKKYFWYAVHPASFGFYFDFHNPYGLRFPFLDIYLKR